MQNVSTVYKESMKSSLRERAYIKLSFGVFNREIQTNATVEQGNFADYSNSSKLFSETPPKATYATLEENFTKVDGMMYFLPRGGTESVSDVLVSSDSYTLTDKYGVYLSPTLLSRMTYTTSPVKYLDTGLVSDLLISEAICEVNIDFNVLATDFKGITIDFGENYPVDFDIVSDSGQTIEIRGNDRGLFVSEEVIENATSIKFVFYRMKNTHSRLRIYSIRFGYGLAYNNNSVISSTLDSYVSPIGADMPQIDFSVTLSNYDKYFNVDNPDSAIHFLETGEEMEIFYGYQLPDSDEIEWVRGGRLQCSEWESDDTTATIRAQDIFRNMDSEYYKGKYNSTKNSYRQLAESVLAEAGITNYYLDPCLDNLYTTNPLPRVTHKEALQIIANACRCVLSQSREGEVVIKSFVGDGSNIADFTMTRTDMTSSPKAVKQERVKEVVVPCYSYISGDKEESLISEDITVSAGDVVTFYLSEPSYGFRATVNGSNDNDASVVASGSYYVTVKVYTAGTIKLEIFGYRYNIVERYVVKTLNNKGKTIKWENPLISDMVMAADLAEWLGEYYASGVEYEYDTRGNPELDVNDIIYQENDFRDGMMVNVYQHTIRFNNSFSGSVIARRIGG